MTEASTPVAELDPPALLVDFDRVARNTASLRAGFAHGVAFRPHAKTHKTPEIGLLQLRAGTSGPAVAKTGEAEVLFAGGLTDFVVANTVVGAAKWERPARCRGCGLTTNVDGELATRGLRRRPQWSARRPPSSGAWAEIGRLVDSLPGLELADVRPTRPRVRGRPRRRAPRRALLVGVTERAHGLGIRHVTAGSTPTGRAVAAVPRVTEVQAGTDVFNDLIQLGIGPAGADGLALTVLRTAVGRAAAPRRSTGARRHAAATSPGSTGRPASSPSPPRPTGRRGSSAWARSPA